jgi:hypothetical protein
MSLDESGRDGGHPLPADAASLPLPGEGGDEVGRTIYNDILDGRPHGEVIKLRGGLDSGSGGGGDDLICGGAGADGGHLIGGGEDPLTGAPETTRSSVARPRGSEKEVEG